MVSLPAAETERRWKRDYPTSRLSSDAVFNGVSQNQFMARHRANHVNVAYAPSAESADKALAAKAAMLAELGIAVHVCGATKLA